MLFSPRLLALAALAHLTLTAGALRAQDTDYSITDIRVLQILEDGALVGDRPVTVRTMVGVTGPNDPPAAIDALLRVYVDGVEAADSPVYSLNGPALIEGNSIKSDSKTMLNFACIPPVSTDVVFEVQLNPPGPNHVPEAVLGNNSASTASLSFREQEVLTLMYSPIDYRPGGGTLPNLPDPDLIKPGVGDAFVQGIYPGGVMEYRRSDAPSKLWTGSLSSSGSALNSSLNTDLLLTNPQPDFIYGWVNGGLPYNGMAFINGVAAMGNTEPSRHQRTYAHELGHNFGLSHNSLVMGVFGEDVERHLFVPTGLKKVKLPSLYDIMVAGQLTKSAWVHPNSFTVFLNHPDLSLPATDLDSADAGEPSAAVGRPTPHLLVSGRWDRATGELLLDPVLEVLTDHGSRPAAAAHADLLLLGLVDGEVAVPFAVTARNSGDEGGCVDAGAGNGCGTVDGTVDGTGDGTGVAGTLGGADTVDGGGHDSDQPFDPVTHFAVLMPATSSGGRALQGLSVVGTGSHPLRSVQRRASAHAPVVQVLSPAADVPTGSLVTLRWAADDADGDALSTTVRYVPDGRTHSVPLVTHSTARQLTVDMTGLPQFVPGSGYFELLVSDGFRTTRARTAALTGPGAYAGAGGALPFVEIYHPDDGTSFNKGANLILHSSGWDLEDGALTGASVEWFSDVDGRLGTGRRFVVDDLSVGDHLITVIATDSGGQQSSATHAIVVNDRDLPDLPGEICAIDLGLGGPGSAGVSLCGGDLTTGGSADLELVGGPANTPAYLLLGLTNGSVPLKGGTVVPFPWDVMIDLSTNGSGALSVPGITGPGFPATVFLQYVLVDGGQAQGFAFSNALQVEF